MVCGRPGSPVSDPARSQPWMHHRVDHAWDGPTPPPPAASPLGRADLVPPCGEVLRNPFHCLLRAHRRAFDSNLKCVIGLNVLGTSQLIFTLYVNIRYVLKTLKVNSADS